MAEPDHLGWCQEGCGRERRKRSPICRQCYRRKWMADKRARQHDSHSWVSGAVDMDDSDLMAALDDLAFQEWWRAQD